MFLKALSDVAGGHKHVDHQNDARVQEVAEFAVKQVVICASAVHRSYCQQACLERERDRERRNLRALSSLKSDCAIDPLLLLQISEKTSKKLDLVKINSAQKQVVAGLNYVLVVETAADSEKETYEAHVYGEIQVIAHTAIAHTAIAQAHATPALLASVLLLPTFLLRYM